MGRKQTKLTPIKSEEKIRAEKQAHFLLLLSQTCNVTLSAHGTGISRITAYEWRNTNPEFAKAWEDALQQAVELLEAEAWNRARKQSDTLMIFLLKAHKPDMYRETLHYKGEVKVSLLEQELMAQGIDPKVFLDTIASAEFNAILARNQVAFKENE